MQLSRHFIGHRVYLILLILCVFVVLSTRFYFDWLYVKPSILYVTPVKTSSIIMDNLRRETTESIPLTTTGSHKVTQNALQQNESRTAQKRPHYMTISGNGRLGNKMFQFAALLGTSHRHNYTPYISNRNPLFRVFNIPYVKNIPRLENMKMVGEGAAGKYYNSIETLAHNVNYSLAGYYQSWKYFDFIGDIVRKSFTFKPHIMAKVKMALKTYKEGQRPYVGVHVRRSDMNSPRELRRGYNVATKQYFDKALNFFRNNLTDPIFLVVSDDTRWSKANIKGEDVRFVSSGDPGGDIAILAHCNHTVVSSGTFGWWGGYLSGGTVVYFQNYPTRKSWLETQYNREDYYPSSWIGME